MTLEGSLKSHEFLLLSDFLWDFVNDFNARVSLGQPCARMDHPLLPVVHIVLSSFSLTMVGSIHSFETILVFFTSLQQTPILYNTGNVKTCNLGLPFGKVNACMYTFYSESVKQIYSSIL